MRSTGGLASSRVQNSPSRGLNFSMSSMGSPSKNGHTGSTKSTNRSTFPTAIHSIQCQIHGHSNKLVQWVCMANDCQYESRLVCSKCNSGPHSSHQKQMIKVQELFENNDDQNIQNWPLEETGRQIKEYVNFEGQYTKGLYDQIDAFFDGLKEQMLKKLEQLKSNLISDVNQFHLRGDGQQKFRFIETLRRMYLEAYDFDSLQSLIKKFFLREITYDTFQTGINFFLGNKEKQVQQTKLHKYFSKNIQNSQMTEASVGSVRIDTDNLQNLQKQITDGFNRFQSSINITQAKAITTATQELPFTPTIGFQTSNLFKGANGKSQPNWGLQFQELLNFMNKQNQQLSDRDTLTYKKEFYADNSKYEGFFLNGQRHLIGARYYSDGNIYFGQWERGIKQGNGVMNFSTGSFYQGEWFNDKKHGQAVEIYPNNSRYEGQFEDGYKHGFGKFTYSDGKAFEGVYVQDKRNGIGKFIYKNSNVEQVYYVMGEIVTEEKYEQYLQLGGYTTMSQMKNQIQDANNYQDSSQSNYTYTYTQNQ